MFRYYLFTTVILLFLTLPVCGGNFSDSTAIEFESLELARYITPNDSGTAVIKNVDEWNSFLEENYFADMPLDPPVDFEEEIIIAVFWGCNYSGCNNITESIKSIQLTSSGIEVNVSPLSDLGDCQMIVCPIQMVKMDRIEAEVCFNFIQSR